MTQEELKKYLYYDMQSGNFYWKFYSGNRIKIGNVAGSKTNHGYISIRVNKHRQYAHRLAWLYVYGKIPKQLDHINRNGTDNRISNLRECTQAENMKNVPKLSTNKSGYKGVSWAKNNRKWVVYARHKGKKVNLGYYECIKEAANVYKNFALEHHKQFINL